MAVKEKIEEWKKKLDTKGRIVVRPSGTEPKIRVMVEGEDEVSIKEALTELVEVVKKEIGE